MLMANAHKIPQSIKAMLLLKGHCMFAMTGVKTGNMSEEKIT